MILHTQGLTTGFRDSVIGKVTLDTIADIEQRQNYILVNRGMKHLDVEGYAAVLTDRALTTPVLPELKGVVPTIHAVESIEAFKPGQVVVMNGRTGVVRILFRPESRFNYILATERCNSRCLMCSQPPRDADDGRRIHEHLRLVELVDRNTEFLGITGGEPTLLRDDFLRLIQKCRDHLPLTHLHILTNGRLFYYESFARKLAGIAHPRLTLGIPLYSDIAHEHDFVVQAKGAFQQTVIGLQNLSRHNQNIEIRIVIHALTYKRLPMLARYLYRNFPFAAHIALMGLEITGYTKPNLDVLWIDPVDYQDELEEAINLLSNRGMHVSIYNHQLCILRRSLWPFARKAISDWKNVYMKECEDCVIRDQCGGFFASAKIRHSAHITPYKAITFNKGDRFGTSSLWPYDFMIT